MSDYLAFLKVLVNGGIWNGVQLLKPETFEHDENESIGRWGKKWLSQCGRCPELDLGWVLR